MTRFNSLCLAYLCLNMITAQGQTPVKGKVQNAMGKNLQGVTVQDKKNNVIIQTDRNGNFQLQKGSKPLEIIKFSAIGFEDKEVLLDTVDQTSDNEWRVVMIPLSLELDEVLVTGRRNNSYLTNSVEMGGKFSGTLKDLPQSVSLVSKEFMEDKQAFLITDMAQDLAGVNLASSYDDFTIRGFRSGYNSGLRLVNGMRSAYGYGTSYFRSPLTVNLETIEVLKGPGASLFGDIVPGGTINMVTKKPLEEDKLAVNFAFGSFQTLRSTIDLTGALDSSKKILYRLNVGYENSKTFRDNNQRKTLLFAPSFTFKPVDGTQIDVDMVYDNFNGFLDRGIGIRNNDLYALPRGFNVNQPSDYFHSNFITLSARLSQKINENLSFHASYMKAIYQEDLNELRTLNTFSDAPANTIMNMRFLEKKMKDYTDNLVSYLSYSNHWGNTEHRMILGVDYASYSPDRDNVQKEARSRVLDGDTVRLTVDLDNPIKELISPSSYVWLPQASFPFLNPYKSVGIYFQDQVTIGDKWHIIFGLRHERYSSSSADLLETYNTSQSSWLPRFGLTYKINNQVNYFASYSQGYIPVGADFVHNHENYGANTAFKPEKSYQIETGFKMGFFNNQLQTEMSVFHINRRNMLMSTGAVSEAGFPIYRQSGEVYSQGIELDFRGQITKDFQLSGNYSFNHTGVKTSSIQSEVGQMLPNAPRHVAGLWAKYVIPKNALKGLGFGAGLSHVSNRRMENFTRKDNHGNEQWDKWPAYTTINAALYYHVKGVRLSLNANNILDKYYYLGGFDYTRGFVGAPRNFMISMGYSF